jgi:2-methylcitrate dehydratase PrpD
MPASGNVVQPRVDSKASLGLLSRKMIAVGPGTSRGLRDIKFASKGETTPRLAAVAAWVSYLGNLT